MNDKDKPRSGSASMLEGWLKTYADFMQSSMKMMSEGVAATGGRLRPEESPKGRMAESWEAAMRSWKTTSTILNEPGVLEGLAKGVNTLPDIVIKLMKPGWETFLHMQEDFMKRADRIGKSTAAYNFENLDQEMFKVWTELYEKEFRQFLHMPQLGLTRAYQERVSEAADKFNIFQASVSELVSLLYLPMEKSLKVMQDQLAEMAETGKLPENSKAYYRMWVKILEGHYMTLFKSPEYNQTLSKTLEHMGEFLTARQRIVQDALSSWPVPTQDDLDELYKEIYLLKKRIRELEKKNADDSSSVTPGHAISHSD